MSAKWWVANLLVGLAVVGAVSCISVNSALSPNGPLSDLEIGLPVPPSAAGPAPPQAAGPAPPPETGVLIPPPEPGDTAEVRPEDIYPSRLFAGPKQYPPTSFAAYGIVAFPSRAARADVERYQMICEAYATTLPHFKEVGTLPAQQMVTVWPIDDEAEAQRLNAEPREDRCQEAVLHYGLLVPLQAIKDANQSNATIKGRGPLFACVVACGTEGSARFAGAHIRPFQCNHIGAGQGPVFQVVFRHTAEPRVMGTGVECGEVKVGYPPVGR